MLQHRNAQTTRLVWRRTPSSVPRWRSQAESSQLPKSRTNLNRRPIRHGLPNLLNLLIRNCNAPIRPILHPVRNANPPIPIRQSMHKHAPARRNAIRPRSRTISRIRIRNVNRFVKLTVRIPRIESVDSLRSLMIPLPRLRPRGIATQRHLVRLMTFPSLSTAACASQYNTDPHTLGFAAVTPARSHRASKQ
jgi:hypothetical protein